MTAEIIQFGSSSVPQKRVIPACVENACDVRRVAAGQQSMTPTAKNRRLRDERWKAWRNADRATNYWLARFKFYDAVFTAVEIGLPEARSDSCNLGGGEYRQDSVNGYREAVRKQIFTPAPDIAAVNWKRVHLKQALWTGAKREHIEQIIADDVAFLKAHPVRRAAPAL